MVYTVVKKTDFYYEIEDQNGIRHPEAPTVPTPLETQEAAEAWLAAWEKAEGEKAWKRLKGLPPKKKGQSNQQN